MKRYYGYQFKQAVEALTLKIAKELKASVTSIRWIASIPTAGTNDKGEVFYADVADDAVLYDIDVQRYVGFAVHEILHQKYTTIWGNVGDQYLDSLHNACEDAWIEHQGINASLTGTIGGLLTALLDQMVGEANATVSDWTDPRQYPFIFAVYLRRHVNTYVPIPDGLEPIIHGADKMLEDCKSSADTVKVAKWIMAQLKRLPQASNSPEKAPKRPSEAQSGEGEGEGKGEGNNRTDGNPHPSPGSARAPKAGTKATEVEPSNNLPEGKAGPGSWSEGATLGLDGHHLGSKGWLNEPVAVPARLRYEVKRLFDKSGTDDFQRGRRSGAIDVRALHKVGLTDKLFQRRHEVEGIDSAVVICLDVSGSMFDDGKTNHKYGHSNRIVQATLAAQALLDTLQRAQVATCVLTFGSMTAVAKPWHENGGKGKLKLNRVSNGGSTNDYFAVRYAHKLLLNRPEQRKVCFVITDGVGEPKETKEQCLTGERLGITTIGIGVQLDVSGVYPQSIHVSEVTDLATTSFKQIKLAA